MLTTTIMLITWWKVSFVVIIRKILIHSKLNSNPSSRRRRMRTSWTLLKNIQNWITINYPKKSKRIYKLIVITIGQCLMKSRRVISILNKIDCKMGKIKCLLMVIKNLNQRNHNYQTQFVRVGKPFSINVHRKKNNLKK